ncbi:MAG: polyprenyl synthetase family protein [Planctomycetes bacterium]|nr:polyprenyl synthetase family protein [Planctomycetota bacterium]
MSDKTREQSTALGRLLEPYGRQVEKDIGQWLIEPDAPAELAEAVKYCAVGGKRLRPAIAFMSAEAVGGRMGDELTRRCAVAVELVHCYSLVHDDLPAMDNDELRRGLPTAHVKFGQAMAILAGDAMLTRAFGVLGEYPEPRAGLLAAELSWAAGQAGMIAGQAADMNLCKFPAGADGLRYIHLRKTAAIIRAAARMGAICGGANPSTLDSVSDFAEALGLAFQIYDDLLDVTGDAASTGKNVGKDARAGKRTHAAEIGLAAAGKAADDLTARAVESLAPLGQAGRRLAELAGLLSGRDR